MTQPTPTQPTHTQSFSTLPAYEHTALPLAPASVAPLQLGQHDLTFALTSILRVGLEFLPKCVGHADGKRLAHAGTV